MIKVEVTVKCVQCGLESKTTFDHIPTEKETMVEGFILITPTYRSSVGTVTDATCSTECAVKYITEQIYI